MVCSVSGFGLLLVLSLRRNRPATLPSRLLVLVDECRRGRGRPFIVFLMELEARRIRPAPLTASLIAGLFRALWLREVVLVLRDKVDDPVKGVLIGSGSWKGGKDASMSSSSLVLGKGSNGSGES